MKSKHRKIIGITLIVLGCCIVGVRVGGKYLFEQSSKQEVNEFLEKDIPTIDTKKNQSVKEIYKDIKPGNKIGVIEIKDLGVQHIIVEDTQEAQIKKNVGHFIETSMPGQFGNFSLAGHRNNLYNEVFKGLADVEIGTEIVIKALNGEFKYQIYKKEVIEPDNFDVLSQDYGKKEMTIITCTKDGKKRVCVKAKMI